MQKIAASEGQYAKSIRFFALFFARRRFYIPSRVAGTQIEFGRPPNGSVARTRLQIRRSAARTWKSRGPTRQVATIA